MNRERLSDLGLFLILIAFLVIIFAPEGRIAALLMLITGLALFYVPRFRNPQDD